MNRPRVTITTGAVGPSLLADRYRFRAFARRDYSDGLTMILEYRETGETVAIDDVDYPEYQTVATVFVRRDGLAGGWHRRTIASPADIGALYRGFRAGLVKLELYPLFDDDGHRRSPGGAAMAGAYGPRWAPDSPVRPGETGRSLV